MELVLVRHAQPEWVRDDISQVDPGLTEVGLRQAELVAQRLAPTRFDHLLVSTSRRAQHTARPVRAELGDVPATDRAWLHEIHLPQSFADTPAEEVGHVLRDARDRPREDWWEGLPGGESFRDFHERVTTGLMAELAAFGARRTPAGLWELAQPAHELRLLLVAHAGTNSVVLGALLGLEPEPWEWERFASEHASVTLLRTTPMAGRHIFGLQRFSDVQHLPDELVTA